MAFGNIGSAFSTTVAASSSQSADLAQDQQTSGSYIQETYYHKDPFGPHKQPDYTTCCYPLIDPWKVFFSIASIAATTLYFSRLLEHRKKSTNKNSTTNTNNTNMNGSGNSSSNNNQSSTIAREDGEGRSSSWFSFLDVYHGKKYPHLKST